MEENSSKVSSLSCRVVKAVAFILVVLSWVQPLEAEVSDKASVQRLAIISSEEILKSGLADLLTVKLQELPDVQLVERDMLQKVMEEIKLSMLMDANQTENRRKAGALLKADILIILSSEEILNDKNKKTIAKVIISDCTSGARLRIGWVPLDLNDLKKVCDSVSDIINETLVHFKDGIKQIIGVSPFISRDLVHDYDYLQGGYANLLGNAISTAPGIAVIEAEEAKSIRYENVLAGKEIADRVVPLFAEGEFRINRDDSSKNPKVRIKINIADSNAVRKTIELDNLDFNDVSDFLISQAASEILQLSKLSALQILDKDKQFDKLIERASEFAAVGDWQHSTSLREAAVLLKPHEVEQRKKLISEYCLFQNLMKTKVKYNWQEMLSNELKTGFMHLDYLIQNKLITMYEAIKLSDTALMALPWAWTAYPIPNQPTEAESFKKTFLKAVYPQILKISGGHASYDWYDTFLKHIAQRRDTSERYSDKSDLDLYLYLHEKLLPGKMVPNGMFVRFLDNHAKDGWDKDISNYKQAGYFSDKDFIGFVTELSESTKPLSSFYGRYALLARKFYNRENLHEKVNEIPQEVNDLKTEAFAVWPKDKNNSLITALKELQNKIVTYTNEAEQSKESSLKQNEESQSEKNNKVIESQIESPIPKVMGKVIFKRIAFERRESSGKNYRWYWDCVFEYESPQCLKCGNSLDVIWFERAVMFLKQPGVLEDIVLDKIESVISDGNYVWISKKKEGILIFDTSGRIVTTIDATNDLPPFDRALKLYTIGEGKVFATGSFGGQNRAWCAIIEYKNSKVMVKVIHEAKRVWQPGEKSGTLENDPNLVFVPSWIREYYDNESGSKTLIVARDNRRYPLEIDLKTLDVKLSPVKVGGSFSQYGLPWPPVEYNGKRYTIEHGRLRCTDLETNKSEELVDSNLPAPYDKIDNLWISANYGLVGYSSDREFYQIIITQDNHDIIQKTLELAKADGSPLFYHTFSFKKNENEEIYDLKYLNVITIEVGRGDNLILRHDYNTFKNGVFMPLGTYEVSNANGAFPPIEVTSSSPRHLVFEPVAGRVEYYGKVINAVNGQPVEGATVRVENGAGFQYEKKWSTITKVDGKFEVAFRRQGQPYSFKAIKENYMPIELTFRAFPTIADGKVELVPLPLFPAATIKIEPIIEALYNGNPCTEAFNVDVRVRCVIQEGADSKLSEAYSNIEEGYADPSTYTNHFLINYKNTFPVPAGIPFTIRFYSLSEGEWIFPEIQQTFNLKQGEIMDLGRLDFKPAVKVYLKVVNSKGYPIKDIVIKKATGDFFRQRATTDYQGVANIYLNPRIENKFNINFGNRYGDRNQIISMDLGKDEKSVKGFIVTLSETGQVVVTKSDAPLSSEPQIIAKDASAKPVLTNITFSKGATEDNTRPLDNIKEISLDNGKVYIFTYWQLSVEEHEYRIKATDSLEKVIYEYQTNVTPYNNSWCLWNWHPIDKEKNIPGKWKYEIYMDGEKFREEYLTVLP